MTNTYEYLIQSQTIFELPNLSWSFWSFWIQPKSAPLQPQKTFFSAFKEVIKESVSRFASREGRDFSSGWWGLLGVFSDTLKTNSYGPMVGRWTSKNSWDKMVPFRRHLLIFCVWRLYLPKVDVFFPRPPWDGTVPWLEGWSGLDSCNTWVGWVIALEVCNYCGKAQDKGGLVVRMPTFFWGELKDAKTWREKTATLNDMSNSNCLAYLNTFGGRFLTES